MLVKAEEDIEVVDFNVVESAEVWGHVELHDQITTRRYALDGAF